jgi:Zinc finger, ZZ type
MNKLGRCLIHLHDLEDARQPFRQRLEFEKTAEEIVHQAWCDNSSTLQKIRGERYVCQTCPDADLCSPCMKMYDADTWSFWCRKHQFLRVLDGVADDAQPNETRLSGEMRKQWLERLSRKYQD